MADVVEDILAETVDLYVHQLKELKPQDAEHIRVAARLRRATRELEQYRKEKKQRSER